MSGGKNKHANIRAYALTLEAVRKHIKKIPGMTIIRFYDEAVRKQLNSKSSTTTQL